MGEWDPSDEDKTPVQPVEPPEARRARDLRAELWANKEAHEDRMAFAVAKDLREQLRAALAERDKYRTLAEKLSMEVLELKRQMKARKGK